MPSLSLDNWIANMIRENDLDPTEIFRSDVPSWNQMGIRARYKLNVAFRAALADAFDSNHPANMELLGRACVELARHSMTEEAEAEIRADRDAVRSMGREQR